MSQGDIAHGADSMGITVALDEMSESIRWSPVLTVEKYDDDMTEWALKRLGLEPGSPVLGSDFEGLGVKPYETLVREGNLLTTAGLNRLTSLLIGAGGQALTNTATRIGVGNSSTAAAVGQTDLQAAAGAANRQFKVMDATYPQQANGVMTARSSFQTGEANFVWAEWGIDVAAPTVTDGTTVNALLFNRAVQALGTKASGVWTATATVTIT
jgi:hypothetical protein